MNSDRDIMLLCNFDEKCTEENGSLSDIWSGVWSIDDTDLCKSLIETKFESEPLTNFVKTYKEQNGTTESLLLLAIKSFLTFCERNWNPHPDKLDLEQFLGTPWPKEIDTAINLQRDSEPLLVNILYPELFYLSRQIFMVLFTVDEKLVHNWWYFRALVIHQRVLEDTSASLCGECEPILGKLKKSLGMLQDKPRLQILLCLEIAQAFLVYTRVQGVEKYLLRASGIAGLKLELTGVLGKRTKYQEKELPQLALSSKLDANVERPTAKQSHGTSELPPDIELQDDVRLNKIDFKERISNTELPSLEQIMCLLTAQYKKKAQPKDNLMAEELQPYIDAVLSQKNGAWSTRVSALLIRCKFEAGHKRTVERAMVQCETIVTDKKPVAPTTRLSYLWASGLAPAWTWRRNLAELYMSLGLVKAALEEYEQLQLWEEVIVCYNLLHLRHKAAEVIKQQIEIQPTVKLYCLLGDATDDVSWYEKAWEFSNHKSSRAQRHWGHFLFCRRQYEECIPYYEKSVEINSLQEIVWMRLGYAALITEKWEISARAYRWYTYLQPNIFEAWNNLAKVYVKQGDLNRGYRALMEALKYNYDNWRLWDNVVIVSLDTCHFEDVIRGCHRILDLRHKYEDLRVLTLLVFSIEQDIVDADGNRVSRLKKRVLELFGRITSIQQNKPEIWQLYSDISPTNLLKAQRLLKAYRGYTQRAWANDLETCKEVIQLTKNLLEYSLKASKESEDRDKFQCDQQLSSARLTGQAVIKAVEKQEYPDTKEDLEELNTLFNEVTEYIKANK
ncbi:tetratricopeptide repeat protein 27 [Aphomia sociella]